MRRMHAWNPCSTIVNSVSKTTRRIPLTSRVSVQVLELLVSERLTEGDSIPPTGELAERFGVSRTVVREALAELTGRGVIQRQQGREGVVAVPGSDQLSALLRSRADSNGYTFGQLHELRVVLEIEAARLSARHATLQDVAALSDLLHVMHKAEEVDDMLEADLEYHRAIAECANPLFGLVLDGLSPLLMDSRRSAWESYVAAGGQLTEVLDRHTILRDRIAARDEVGAVEAMRADLTDTQELLGRME